MRHVYLFVALAACGGGNYVYVANGGVPVEQGSCTDVTLVGDLQVVQPKAQGCEQSPGFVVPEHAAAVFWQVSTTTWAGPVIAPEADVEVAVVAPLETGGSDKRLESGVREKGLETGTREKALETGTREKALETGQREKALETGTRDKALETGQREKALETGTREKALETGTAEQGLESGARSVAPIALSKTAKGRADREKPARFVLTVTNVSAVTVNRLAVVDRVDRGLRVEADDAVLTPLADGSTLVTYRSNEPLAAHGVRFFSMNVYPR